MNEPVTKKAGTRQPAERPGDNHPSAVWDRFAIKAEVQRRGANLRAIAEAAGLEKSALRVALARPFPAAERVLSEFLGIPPFHLWPDRYDQFGNRLYGRAINHTKPRLAPSRRNRNAA